MPLTPAQLASQLLPISAFGAERTELLNEVAQAALVHVQADTPVLTGLLQSSEAVYLGDEDAAVESDVRYGPFVNERVQFLETGADATIADAEAALQRFGEKIVRRWANG